MYKWLENKLGITELENQNLDLQVVIDNQDSEIKSYLQKIKAQSCHLRGANKRIAEVKELESRAIKAEQALEPTKKSLEVLTAERSKWQRKIKRLENKR